MITTTFIVCCYESSKGLKSSIECHITNFTFVSQRPFHLASVRASPPPSDIPISVMPLLSMMQVKECMLCNRSDFMHREKSLISSCTGTLVLMNHGRSVSKSKRDVRNVECDAFVVLTIMYLFENAGQRAISGYAISVLSESTRCQTKQCTIAVTDHKH
jgi:hypothetical protein